MLLDRAMKGRDSYWPKDMDNAAQYRAVVDFERAIYPIWRGIEVNDIEREAKMTNEEVRNSLVLFECQTLHRQDIAIHNSGIKPQAATAETVQEFRKKAAASDRLQRIRGEE